MSVLVLQGNGEAHDYLISSLETQGFKPVRSLSRVSGLAGELAQRVGLSAVLVDLALDQDLAACQQIRAADATLPLLVVFDEDSAIRLEEALAVGASGCIPEPLNPLELAAKLRAAIRQNRCVHTPEPDGGPACSDPLTNLANDRSFHLKLDRAWHSGTPLTVILLNIDHFAQFNQLYGRSAGDDCLCRIASANSRRSVSARRSGGAPWQR